MHRAKRRDVRLVTAGLAVVACALLCALASPAHARHTDKERITDQTAYTFGKNQIQLGLWQAGYGILDNLDVFSYTLPWLLQTANIHTKYRFYDTGKWSFSGRVGVFRLDFQDFSPDAPPATFTIIPFHLGASYQASSAWTFSAETVYTSNRLEGQVDVGDLRGSAAVTNLQLTATAEWRWSETFAIVTHARALAFQDTNAAANFVYQPDDYTTVEVYGAAETDLLDVQGAWSIVPSAFWSWDTFNLRAGLGYGNFNIPGFNIVFIQRSVIPEFDMFWRW